MTGHSESAGIQAGQLQDSRSGGRRVDTAVVLAAGVGRRALNLTLGAPKAFLQVGEQSLIERSLDQLRRAGIRRVFIVTGFGAARFDALCPKRGAMEIRTVRNPLFAASGSMYSLMQIHGLVEGPFLLLESDLIYESRALQLVLECPRPNAILLSGLTRAGDEVFVETMGDRVWALSKYKTTLGSAKWELVGISRLDLSLHQALIEHCREFPRETFPLAYEDCICRVARSVTVYGCKVEDLIWAEIDDENHYRRVTRLILPKIRNSEGRVAASDDAGTVDTTAFSRGRGRKTPPSAEVS